MIKRFETNARLSRVVVHNGTVYVAGTSPDTATASPGDQAREILAKIDGYLRMANSDKSRLLSAVLYVKDLANLDPINKAWESWLPAGHAPGRTCVEATPALSQFAVTISVIAAAAE